MRYINKWIHLLKDVAWWIVIFTLGFMCGAHMIEAKADDNCIGATIELPKSLIGEDGNDYLEQVEKINQLLQDTGELYTLSLNYRSQEENANYYESIEIVIYDKSVINATSYIVEYSSSYNKYKRTLQLSQDTDFEKYENALANNTYKTALYSTSEAIYLYQEKYKSAGYYYAKAVYSHNLTSLKNQYKDCSYKLNDVLVPPGAEMITYSKIFLPLKNIYNVNNIDHIEVEFDMNSIPESAIIPNEPDHFKFKMTYDIKITDNEQATTLATNTTLDIPQIEYIQYKEDGTQNYSKYGLAYNRNNQYNKYFDKDSYTNTFFTKYDYNRSLKVIINVRDINDVFLSLDLQSNLKYKINVFYRENVEDYQQYYQTVDITSKYAVLFMPRLRQNGDQTAVSSYFLSNGKFQVEERDNYTDNFTLYKEPTVVNGTNQYYYFYTPYLSVHYNDSFYYKNLNYPNADVATIQYDSRYFVVSVCKTEFECEIITNPNTNETITPTPPHDKAEWSFSKLIERVKKFVNDLHSKLDPITATIQYFYNQLPNLIQNFLLVIYIVMLLFATIKVLRR